MAAPADKSVTLSGTGMTRTEDALQNLITTVNYLTTAVRAICTKLDADAGVTDANYFSTIPDASGSSPAQVLSAKVNL